MKQKSQGYRIARTAARQSHGMKPNFIHWLQGIIDVSWKKLNPGFFRLVLVGVIDGTIRFATEAEGVDEVSPKNWTTSQGV